MLENIFASKMQAKLLKLLYRNPNGHYYQREIAQNLNEPLSSLQYEIRRLEKIGIIYSQKKNRRTYYHLNKNFYLYPEIRDIIVKTAQKNLKI